MICDKCGKSNIAGLPECSYCGTEMPKVSACGGFADILTFNSQGETEREKTVERISDLEMQNLIKKSDGIMKSTKINSLFGLIAIGLSFLILVSSIVFGIVTINAVKSYNKETMAQSEETKKELAEYKKQLNTLLEKIDGDKDDDQGKVDNKDPDEDKSKQETPKDDNMSDKKNCGR